MHASADTIAGFENQQLAAAQRPGRAQPANAGTDDDGVIIGRLRSDGSPFAYPIK
jgi:hypothetical protein